MSKQKTQQISFNAIKVSQGTFDFYLSVLSANQILPLCSTLRETGIELFSSDSELWQESDGRNFIEAVESSEFAKTEFIKEVEQIQQEPYDKDRPFQRIVDMTRVQNIAAYLREEDALMPNPVILATRDTVTVEVQSDECPLKITLKWEGETPTNIIDGQHRLKALGKLISDGHTEFKDFAVPFTLLVDFPFYMQAEMFAVINGRQKSVNKSRIYDLLGYMPLNDPSIREKAYKGEMAVHRFCHHVVKVLDESSRSPWNSLIKMRGSGKGIIVPKNWTTG